jgi:hypothetical protein
MSELSASLGSDRPIQAHHLRRLNSSFTKQTQVGGQWRDVHSFPATDSEILAKVLRGTDNGVRMSTRASSKRD